MYYTFCFIVVLHLRKPTRTKVMEIPKAVKDFLEANPSVLLIDTKLVPIDRARRARAIEAQQELSLNKSVSQVMKLFVEYYPQYDDVATSDRLRRMVLGRDVAYEDEEMLQHFKEFGGLYRQGKLQAA